MCALSLLFFLASLGTLRSTRDGIGGDEVSYFALAEGKLGEAGPPYRYRVLVPMVASVLPWSIPENFRVLNFVAIVATGAGLGMFLSRCGVGGVEMVVGLLAFYALEPVRYVLSHPYGVDGLTWLICLALFWAVTAQSATWFGFAAVIGVAAKEVILPFLPAYLLGELSARREGARWGFRGLLSGRRETLRVIVACGGPVLLFLGLRFVLSGGQVDLNPYVGFGGSTNQMFIARFVAGQGLHAYFSIWWGTFSWIWLVLAFGLAQGEMSNRRLYWFSVWAVAGIIGAAAFVTYPSRLLFSIFPVALLLLCQELGRYRDRGSAFRGALLGIVGLSLVMVGLRNYGTFGAVIGRIPSISVAVGCGMVWLGWRNRQRTGETKD